MHTWIRPTSLLVYTVVKRDKIINLRVTAEEKAVIASNAGSVGTAAYLRQLGLDGAGPDKGIDQAPSNAGIEEQGQAAPAASSTPEQTWKARVRQLCMQGVPQMAAEKIADQEFRG